ncbi:SDR family oxidoreductase [Streptomyces albus subsp. chlorinus]|uniref:SDR family NAD(P)-dependent oxidoreductase n=1 Tax=Streptomyces albus TaxID=1888 RepID=UPI00157034B3|nr:SDR family oxidoreductase [Streptomyces albus]NSC21381.1 SDR family oxidoreductase [Streptomyces albus subsp. chlorinus]
MDFRGKKALVTGSGAIGGLGHAVAKVLAAGGADVTVSGRDPERGARVVEDIGGHTGFLRADLNESEEVRRLADAAQDVDVLVNNAAVLLGATRDLDAYDEAFAVNVRAPFLLTTALAPHMAARGGGSIVNISSTAAGIGMPGMAVYGATKAALESLTRAWAAEYAPMKVRVNAVSPGPMRSTKAVAELGQDVGGFGETVPMARAADPAEVAEVVAFVASHRAGFVTGATVAADGGRSAI